MSSPEPQTWTNDGDLIDLHVGSPQLPRASTCSNAVVETASHNLLDSELLVLEKKLQTCSENSRKFSSDTTKCVDIEDILISIDDNDYDIVDGVNHNTASEPSSYVPQSSSDILLDLYENSNASPSITCANLEALDVLMQLDQILNEECNQFSDSEEDSNRSSYSSSEQETKLTLEECLQDLDNYLKSFDTSGSDDGQDIQSESCSHKSEVCQISLQSSVSSLPEALELDDQNAPEATNVVEGEPNHLERFTQPSGNTNVFACGQTNPGYEITEDNSMGKNEREMVSVNGELVRNHPQRATVAASGHQRLNFQRCPLRQSVGDLCHPRISDRTSGTDVSTEEVIDRNWVQDIARNVSLERRAHAPGDCCTGDVTVEPLQRDSAVDRRESSWLRTSMRRIRHLRLPSDQNATDTENVASTSNEMVAARLETPMHQPRVLQVDLSVVRPFSAPSRLATCSNAATQSSIRERSRSRDSRTSAVSREPGGRARSSSASSRSRRPRSLSSSESSLASSVDTTPSSTPVPHNRQEVGTTANARRPCERARQSDMPEAESPLGHWPHSLSSMLACLGCTLGLFNISRFSILTIHFGANFIFQFFLLSLIVGLPLFSLQLCLGQQLGAGVIDMWRISPLFQGVGIALLASQALIGLYSIIGISWMFVFFRDAFITKMDRYRWAEPFLYYRDDIKPPVNGTYKLCETVPDYFSGVVLQRHHLASGNVLGTIKFQSAFNLAVVWMIVFVSLSKGLRSYGKVIYVFTLIPVFGTFIICAKILSLIPPDLVYVIFPETSWSEFFLNSRSWVAASQEVILTWGLLGASIMQIASHNKHKHLLQRDSSLIAVITLTVLLLAAFLANTCVQILRSYGYNYLPNSFEKINSYSFLRSTRDPLPPNLVSTPVRYMTHQSFILGERTIRPGVDLTSESGYQALRLATELVPTTFALLGSEEVSPFWAVLFYFILILFGIAQQLAIWHCVITGIMAIKAKVLKSWETTITFFSCACGFLLGLPMATEVGIYVVYFMDFTVGGLWWLIIIILLQIMAVFMVRGRPYSGDTVVTALFTSASQSFLMSWAPALLSFTWNVILPVVLMIFCIVFFRNGSFKELFVWHHVPAGEYWLLWARQIGSMIQLLPVVCVPLVAFIQSYRYLNNGPVDILDRVQLLYRPPLGEHMEDITIQESPPLNNNTTATTTIPVEDPPPKYSPPPSYTTATGARIAKFLRQSIRRSVRRIANVLGESSNTRQRPTVQNQLPPPDYNAVLVEMNVPQSPTIVSVGEQLNITVIGETNPMSTLERVQNERGNSSALTIADVACILRHSFRRSRLRTANTLRRDAVADSNNTGSLSAENLVDSAAPIGETSLVLENLSNQDNEIKPLGDNLSSVI